MGAWIETSEKDNPESLNRSHPVWVRGLKLKIGLIDKPDTLVAPRVGAWIETPSIVALYDYEESHPVWVRGLKLSNSSSACGIRVVAPRVGAWIETYGNISVKVKNMSRTPCGCVD